MKHETGPSIIWPLLFAVFGVAALSTAIILVPSMARVYAEERAVAAAPIPAMTAPAETAPAAETRPTPEPAPAAPPVAETRPTPEPAPAVEPQQAPAAETESATGPWTIPLDPSSYALGEGAEAAIDAITAVLARDPKAKVVLTGVNSPDKSSKRARRGADIVKEKITADVGVSAHQVETKSEQDPAVTGMIVRAELAGGAL